VDIRKFEREREREDEVLHAISTSIVLVGETSGEIAVVRCDAVERDRSLDARKSLYIEANPPSKPLNGSWPPVQCAKSSITVCPAALL
jgi:hypothetical protein